MSETSENTANKSVVPSYLKFSKVITYVLYIWILFGIIVLGLRVFLLAFSANASTPFVNFIYETSASFLQPFRGIFPSKSIGETGYLDVAAIFAMIIYALLAWGFAELINYVQAKIDIRKAAAEAEVETARTRGVTETVTATRSRKTTV